MKGDPAPDWLRQKPLCACLNSATREINGKWVCEMCYMAGMEDRNLLSPRTNTRTS
jgi:hypothetical protein